MSESKYAKIIAAEGDGPTRTRGTRVMVGDQELNGVQKIVLTATVDSLWKAEIHCIGAGFTDLNAEFVLHAPSVWQRIKAWLRGS